MGIVAVQKEDIHRMGDLQQDGLNTVDISFSDISCAKVGGLCVDKFPYTCLHGFSGQAQKEDTKR